MLAYDTDETDVPVQNIENNNYYSASLNIIESSDEKLIDSEKKAQKPI